MEDLSIPNFIFFSTFYLFYLLISWSSFSLRTLSLKINPLVQGIFFGWYIFVCDSFSVFRTEPFGQLSSAGSIFLLSPLFHAEEIVHKIHVMPILLWNMSAELEQIRIFQKLQALEQNWPYLLQGCDGEMRPSWLVWYLAHGSSSFSLEPKFTFLIKC